MYRTVLFWIALLVPLLQMAQGSEQVLAQGSEQALKDLSDLQWQSRLILVRDSADAVARLEAERDAIDERDILWFVLTPTGVISNYAGSLAQDFSLRLRKSYFGDAETRVILIGKDGGIKAREATLDLDALFALIDSMPMRRREMQ